MKEAFDFVKTMVTSEGFMAGACVMICLFAVAQIITSIREIIEEHQDRKYKMQLKRERIEAERKAREGRTFYNFEIVPRETTVQKEPAASKKAVRKPVKRTELALRERRAS